MALFTTDFSLPQIGVTLATDTFLAHGLRLRLFERNGVHVHDGVLRKAVGSAEPPKWPTLALSLEGRSRGLAGGRAIEMKRGELLIGRAYGEIGAAHDDGRLRSILVQWDPHVFGIEPDRLVETGHLSASDMVEVEALAHAVKARESTANIVLRVAGLLRKLRALGLALPTDDVASLAAAGPSIDEAVAASLTAAFSMRTGLPAIADVQRVLRRSRADVHRRLGSFLEQGRFAVSSWAGLRSVVTLHAAGMLMTAKNARTEDVAKQLGYSSPTAMCRAFARAGLPSPGNMRAHVIRA